MGLWEAIESPSGPYVCIHAIFFWNVSEKSDATSLTRGGGRDSVQKILRGCATNMGSKITSLLVYECKMLNLVFKWFDFSKFSQNWAKIG